MRLEQGGYSLQPASLVIHELSFGIQRLADGRRKERFRSYLQNLRRLTGCSCPHANAGSASSSSLLGLWLSFALDLSLSNESLPEAHPRLAVMVAAKCTIKNQLTLPKAVVEQAEAAAARMRLVELAISEADVAEAVTWARRP